MPPVNAEHALASKILRPIHIHLKSAGAKLRKPHGRVIFQPRNRPALAAAEFAESFIDGIPAERIAQRRKHNVFRQPLVQRLKMARHTSPSGDDKLLARAHAA